MVSATTTRTAPVGRRHPTTMLDLITVEGLTSGVANIIMQLSLRRSVRASTRVASCPVARGGIR